MSVYQVAEATKIKTEHIRALDEGNYRVFSAPVYIRGFIRTYATHLKLDVPRIMAELDAEFSKTREFRDPPSLSGPARGPLDFLTFQLSRIRWEIAIPLALVVGVVGLGVVGFRSWRVRQAQNPLASLGPGLYQGRVSVGGDLLTVPVPGAVPAQVSGRRF